MSDEPFDQVMTQIDPAMVVVTTAHDDVRAGCLVGFHSQAGMGPDAYAVWLSKANHTFRTAVWSDVFAVHFLSVDDRELARLFGTETGDDVDKFERCRWEPGPGGVPVLTDCGNRLVGRKLAMLDTDADHVGVVLSPSDAAFDGPFEPLRLSDVSDLDPGHEADDRPRGDGR